MKTRAIIKKFLQGLLVLALVLVLIGLGKWQLDSAASVKEAKAVAKLVDPNTYPLKELAAPTLPLDSRNVNKKVSVSGFYVANFRAPLQQDVDGTVSDWEVALLNPEVAMSTKVSLVGTMQPRQYDDRADNEPGVISRLDSSVIVGLVDLQLYDGFITINSESTRDGELVRERVIPPTPVSRTAGYYWQHISYVAIWWLMAAIVLYLPFYRRRIAS
jgi:hypothetical protein